MNPRDPRPLLAVADDLTGAAEVAVLWDAAPVLFTAPATSWTVDASGGIAAGGGAQVGAATVHTQLTTGARTAVVDLDHRDLAPASAHQRAVDLFTAVLRPRPDLAHNTQEVPVVCAKIDSQLRGTVDAAVSALITATSTVGDARAAVVCCPALPALDRVVRGGRVLVEGRPLRQTPTWRGSTTTAPDSVAAALTDVSVHPLPLEALRAGGAREALLQAAASGAVLVPDAETDADLDVLVAAAEGLPTAWAGAAGLLAAVHRHHRVTGGGGNGQGVGATAVSPSPPAGAALFVIGTAAPQVEEQLRALHQERAGVVVLQPTTGAAASAVAAEATSHLRAGALVVLRTPRRAGALSPAAADLVAETACQVLDALAPQRPALLLTGGQTARTVLARQGVMKLHPLAPVHHGAVLSATDDGLRLITRPGSFGGADSLVRCAAALLDTPTEATHPLTRFLSQPTERTPPMSTATPISTTTPMSTATRPAPPLPDDAPAPDRPVIAVTMGDGAGVGPEVVVAALLDPQVRSWCRPVVIGDLARLRLAADVLGLDPVLVAVDPADVADSGGEPGRIDVVDLGLLPQDLPWGEVSAVAGDAAYHYVRVAAELASAGAVQGICTAPLNKAALHAGGHIFPGHTELLAHLTGTEEVSMMLSTPKVKVIHVTTHIGLIDAVARIEPGLVERTVRRGHEALVRAGVAAPRIGVCAINPHAGENGLFGYGEEAEKITPGIEAAQADGIDARGPLPADTAFFLAGRGDYDLIVAMYHDQGHGPVKVLGIEAGVNITVGLPVIRTSVDHGTAFDIAGTGKAEAGSMVEALRQAAEMSPRAPLR